jgi:hypothetical protein
VRGICLGDSLQAFADLGRVELVACERERDRERGRGKEGEEGERERRREVIDRSRRGILATVGETPPALPSPGADALRLMLLRFFRRSDQGAHLFVPFTHSYSPYAYFCMMEGTVCRRRSTDQAHLRQPPSPLAGAKSSARPFALSDWPSLAQLYAHRYIPGTRRASCSCDAVSIKAYHHRLTVR